MPNKSQRPLRFVSFGEALWDLLPDGPVLGGAPLNLAYRIAEMGHESRLVSAVGSDSLGDLAYERMSQLGLSISYVYRIADLPTGVVNIQFRDDGEPEYEIVAPVAYDAVEFDESWTTDFVDVDCICYGTLAQRNVVSRATIKRLLETVPAQTRFCDVNLRPECYTREIVIASLGSATIAKLNNEELIEVCSMVGIAQRADQSVLIAELFNAFRNLRALVVTLGADGAIAIERGGDVVTAPVPPVVVVDPCGAGDAFAASFLVAYLNGASLHEAIALGNTSGARVAEHRGATVALDNGGRPDGLGSTLPNAQRDTPR